MSPVNINRNLSHKKPRGKRTFISSTNKINLERFYNKVCALFKNRLKVVYFGKTVVFIHKLKNFIIKANVQTKFFILVLRNQYNFQRLTNNNL